MNIFSVNASKLTFSIWRWCNNSLKTICKLKYTQCNWNKLKFHWRSILNSLNTKWNSISVSEAKTNKKELNTIRNYLSERVVAYGFTNTVCVRDPRPEWKTTTRKLMASNVSFSLHVHNSVNKIFSFFFLCDSTLPRYLWSDNTTHAFNETNTYIKQKLVFIWPQRE